jgi:hypothetical protein
MDGFGVKCGRDFRAYQPQDLRHGIKILDSLDQIHKNSLLLIQLAEEFSIQPTLKLRTVSQAQSRRNDHEKVKRPRILREYLCDRFIPAAYYAQDKSDNG